MGKWLLTPQIKGVDVYDINTMKLHETIKINNYIYSVGSGNSFFVQDAYLNVFCIDSSLNVKGLGQNRMIMIATANNTAYFVNKLNNYKEYNSINKNGAKKNIPFEFDEYITNICVTDEYTWICTKNGCYRKSEQLSNEFQHIFNYKHISCVIKDKDNNYWIGTTNEGIMFVPSIHNKFYTLSTTPQLLQVTGNKLLYAGKGNCLYEMDMINNTHKVLFQQKNNHEISCFYYDESNNITLVSSDQLYELRNYKENFTIGAAVKEIVKVDHKYYSIPASGVSGFYQLKGNNDTSVWDNIYYQSPHLNYKQGSAFLVNSRGKATTYDNIHQKVYIASNTGLYVVTPDQIKELTYKEKTIQARKVKSYKGHVIILQNNGIVLLINPQGEITEHPFNIKGETVAINKIVLRNNILFIISNGKGVYYMDLDQPTTTIRFIKEIPVNEDVTDIEIWGNKFLVACSGGLLMIDKVKPSLFDAEPKLVINEVKVNDKNVNLDNDNVFEYTENDIHINYSILSFNTEMGYPLFYRINNGNWKLTSPESRDLELTSLKSDNYTIEMRLGNNNRYPVKTLKFKIKKPIWQIHWFWIGIIIVLIIIAFLIYKIRLKQLNTRNKLLLEKIELERNLNKSVLTSIKAQMNPHFFYNALNTIQSFIFADDKKNASTYLSKFSKLTRLILEMSEKELVPLAEEILALNLYLDIEKIRFNNKLEFKISIDELLNPEAIKIPPMIIQPYVENSIKHGLLHKKDDCKLNIEFKKASSGLMVVIDDNGIGRIKSGQLNAIKDNKHQSFSTGANQKRLEILNQDNKKQVIEYIDKIDELGNSTGTTVIISLPILY